MKTDRPIVAVFLALLIFVSAAGAQSLVKRTVYKSDSFPFGAGGTVAIQGAPMGSVRVEGWNKNEIQIEAEIELNARNESELDQIAKVTTFVLEESLQRTSITSVGTHDKSFMKRNAKKFPKELLGLPFRIDYVIKVPRFCDLQIDGGKGDLHVAGVDGVIKINFLDANAKLDLIGGAVQATLGGGTVDVTIPTRAWRGRFADISLASGTMNVALPPSLNAEVDAAILRSGKIDNTFTELKPRTRKDTFTDKLIAAKSGSGGIPLKFTVGDGNLNIAQVGKRE